MMMGKNRIQETFSKAQTTLLIPYVMAGYPDLETTERLLHTLDNLGADMIEVGVPFSDPLADGPILQSAGLASLSKGIHLEQILSLLQSLKDKIRAPLLIMSYINPLFRYNFKSFARHAASAGVSGVIIPDLPFEERGPFAQTLKEEGLIQICMVAPNSSETHLMDLDTSAEGFLYCVSILGVTGNSAKLASNANPSEISGTFKSYLSKVRKATSLPLVLGFGIDGPERIRALSPLVDGLVVGSALVEQIAVALSQGEDPVPAVGTFFHALKTSCIS